MSRHFSKTFIAVFSCAALLYYGVAWAALGCFHDGDHSHRDAARYDVNDREFQHPSSSQVHVNLDCVKMEYHTESMAAPSASRLQQSLPDVSRYASDLTLRPARGEETSALRPRAGLEGFPSLAFLRALPRYLSLSVLRI